MAPYSHKASDLIQNFASTSLSDEKNPAGTKADPKTMERDLSSDEYRSYMKYLHGMDFARELARPEWAYTGMGPNAKKALRDDMGARFGFLGIDFFTYGDPNPHKYTQLVYTLDVLLLALIENGTLLIIDVEKVDDGWELPAGTIKHSQEALRDGMKHTGHGSKEVVAALKELEIDDIEVIRDQRFGFELVGDEALGAQGLRREETYFTVKARNAKRFEARQKKKYPGVPSFQEFSEMFGLN